MKRFVTTIVASTLAGFLFAAGAVAQETLKIG